MKILWEPAELQALLGLAHKPAEAMGGVTFDSRAVKPRDLFIAFKGPVKDGYDFIPQALSRGAVCCLVERPYPDSRALLVKNGVESLQALAYASRARSQAKILGITGSFGKTTAKECAAHLLRACGSTQATEKSYNNHWGVPLSVANLCQGDSFGVFELGMNHGGELAALTQYVRPHVALMTTVGGAHQGNFSSLEAIVDAKCEIFQGMSAGGKVVLPHDHPYFVRMQQHAFDRGLSVITFGKSSQADVRVVSTNPRPGGLWVTFSIQGHIYTYALNAYGHHLVETTLGVMASLYALGVEFEKVLPLMDSFELLPGRGQIRSLALNGKGNIIVVDESYNAGPDSMREALKTFGCMPLEKKGRRWAVLGDMLELGEESRQAHQQLAPVILETGLQGVFLFGPAMKELYDVLPTSLAYGHYDDLLSLSYDLKKNLEPGDSVFVKGSRGQRDFQGRMALVIDYLENPQSFEAKGQTA